MRHHILIALLAVAALTAPASPRWGPVGCAVAQPARGAVAPKVAAYRWTFTADHAQLWMGNRLVGTYALVQPAAKPPAKGAKEEAKVYYPPKEEDAATVPSEAEVIEAGNFGLVESMIAAGGQKSPYLFRDVPVTQQQAMELIEKGLPDEKDKLRLSVLGGTKEERDKIIADLASVPGLGTKCVLWSVPADHFSLRDSETGKPMFEVNPSKATIYVQAAGGKVLHRQSGYNGPADLEAIRKGIDGYDPAKDPDLRRGGGGLQLPDWIRNATKEQVMLVLLAGVVLFLVVKQGQPK